MPDIDVSDVLLDPEMVGVPSFNPTDGITVIRREEVVNQKGRKSSANTPFNNVVASVQPQADAPMIRGPDQQNLPGLIAVYTTFRLQGIAPGFLPDHVVWNGTTYVVNKVFNWNRFGAGFVMAECSSIDHIDQPPSGPS